MVLNRELRQRKRKLPLPPNQDVISHKNPNISPETIPSPSPSPFVPKELPPVTKTDSSLPSIPDTVNEPPTHSYYQNILPKRQIGYFKDTTDSSELLTELADVISKGIDSTLEKVDLESIESEKDLDYATILKLQFDKAAKDYFEAGKKFIESGLKSNATMSFVCGIFSTILGSGENYARGIFNELKNDQTLNDLQSSSLFTLLDQMFEGLDKRSKDDVYQIINVLKRLDTFSAEDQELITNTASYLAKRAEIF